MLSAKTKEVMDEAIHSFRTAGLIPPEEAEKLAELFRGADYPELLKKKEAAKRLGVSTRTLDSWLDKGLLTCKRITPKSIRIDAEELKQFMSAR